jgi:hypothetical protein
MPFDDEPREPMFCAKCKKQIDGAAVCFVCFPTLNMKTKDYLCDDCWELVHKHRRRRVVVED